MSNRRGLPGQIRHKVDNLRRQQQRAESLARLIAEAETLGPMVCPRHSPKELRQQLAETQRNIARHRSDLSALQALRAAGVRDSVAFSRRTSRHRPCRPSTVPSTVSLAEPLILPENQALAPVD